MKKIAIIPAYNEEGRVGKAISSLLSTGSIDMVIVVDDGSTDKTSKEASSSGASVITIEKNIGKGRALKKALSNLLEEGRVEDSDIIIFVDADTEETAVHACKLINVLEEKGSGHFTVAVFPPPAKKGGIGLVKNLAFKFLKKTTGYEFRAPLSGQRAAYLSDLKKALKAFDYGYGIEVAMSYLLCKSGCTPVEVNLPMKHRETGRSVKDFLHRGRQFADVLRVIVNSWLGRLNS